MRRGVTLRAAAGISVAVVAVVALLAPPAARPVAATAGTPAWSPEPLPLPPVRTGSLAAVSCVPGAWCAAVGSYQRRPGSVVPLAYVRSGTTWVRKAAPSPPAGTPYGLDAVSCVSPTFCMAVGSSEAADGQWPLSEMWNGTSWARTAMPGPVSGNGLRITGVSCVSPTFCAAVGWGTSGPVAYVWDGSAWSSSALTSPPAQSVSLWQVSCPASTSCVAVGMLQNDGTDQPLGLVWDGSSWAADELALPTGGTAGSLLGASCWMATRCFAVGWYVEHLAGVAVKAPLLYQWNGSVWARRSVPGPIGGHDTALSGVSCSAVTACLAIGETGISTPIAYWHDGTGWHRVTGAMAGPLSGVSCIPATSCVVVGSHSRRSGSPLPDGYAWDATSWTASAPTAPSGALTSSLAAVTCPSVTVCFAGGTYPDGDGRTLPVLYRRSGATWQRQWAPYPISATETSVAGIACSTAASCVAVGYYSSDGSSRSRLPLADTWDGAMWRRVNVALPTGGQYGDLYGAACTSPTSCFAVGSYTDSTNAWRPLLSRWNGRAWTAGTVRLPPTLHDGLLTGISCPAPGACMAVGYGSMDTGSEGALPLAYQWDGTSWTRRAVAAPPYSNGTYPAAVSCSAAEACMAVGGYLLDSEGRPVSYWWNGTSWRRKDVALPGQGTSGTLQQVSCAAADQCTAVGVYLLCGWNGTTWALQAGVPGMTASGVACPTPTACVAVGSSGEVVAVEVRGGG